MDLISWVALGGLTIINIAGWAYTRAYGFGKLSQKVKDLEKNQNSLRDILNNGLVDKVSHLDSSMSDRMGKLEGTVMTYINLTSDKK